MHGALKNQQLLQSFCYNLSQNADLKRLRVERFVIRRNSNASALPSLFGAK
jgi:hypothetical protein